MADTHRVAVAWFAQRANQFTSLTRKISLRDQANEPETAGVSAQNAIHSCQTAAAAAAKLK